MFPTLTQRKEAEIHTKSRFRRTKSETTYTRRCYEEWFEIWETIDGSAVTDEDVKAFRLQPQGQGHGVSKISETEIRLNCVCDSGD